MAGHNKGCGARKATRLRGFGKSRQRGHILAQRLVIGPKIDWKAEDARLESGVVKKR